MSKMVQIRNVPDALHRKLKVRAAHSGQTLSDYLLAEITHIVERPTPEELIARIRSRPRPAGRIDSARAVRAEREGRR